MPKPFINFPGSVSYQEVRDTAATFRSISDDCSKLRVVNGKKTKVFDKAKFFDQYADSMTIAGKTALLSVVSAARPCDDMFCSDYSPSKDVNRRLREGVKRLIAADAQAPTKPGFKDGKITAVEARRVTSIFPQGIAEAAAKGVFK
ncbi:MAG: hypothetical protein U1E65_31930 [Myxococcota bacterium]